MSGLNKTLSISVLSGKGGVGKSSLALNIAYVLHKLGQKVLLMDCDLGLANLDVLLGISPDLTLQDLLGTGVTAEDIVYPLEPGKLDILPAASGVPELVDMDEDTRSLMLSRLNELFAEYDYLILDLGAGISPMVLSFAAMTHERLVVLTPEPTSLTDSYALIKVLASSYGLTEFKIVVNQVSSEQEGKYTFNRLYSACEKFLNIRPDFIGTIHTDPAVSEAVYKQTPLIKHAPKSRACRDIAALAEKIADLRTTILPALKQKSVLYPFPNLEI